MLGRSVASLIAAFDELERMPPRQAMQRVVYWGVIILAVLLVLLSTWLQNKISAKTVAEVNTVLIDQGWARPLTIVDGRDVALRGTIEPTRNLERLLQTIEMLPSVRTVSQQIEQKPTPSAEIQISRSADKINLAGRLSGDALDLIVQAVKRAFPTAGIRDRIQIDDRLGIPFWIGSAQPALEELATLESFTLFGWRDALMINGVATSATERDALRYALAARLSDDTRISYQVRIREEQGSATISLVSGWNGASLRGRIPDPKTGKQLLRGLVALADVSSEDDVTSDLSYDTSLSSPRIVRQAAAMLPALSKIHDLRMETSGAGLALWGRVDSSEQLGNVIIAIEKAGLASTIDNQVFVDPAIRRPELSLFRDSSRAIVSGRMPGIRARADLLATLEDQLGVTELESFVSVEPNVSFSGWLEKWSILLPAIPDSAFGLTVADGAVIVSGDVADKTAHATLTRALGNMFPDMRLIDWMTIADK